MLRGAAVIVTSVILAVTPAASARAETVERVKDINPQYVPGAATNPRHLAELGGVVLFSVHDDASGSELWRSDGTSPGTFLLQDIVSGPTSSNPSSLTPVSGVVFFTVTTPSGPQLWKTDGTSTGTVHVKGVGNVQGMTNVNGTLFFTTGPNRARSS